MRRPHRQQGMFRPSGPRRTTLRVGKLASIKGKVSVRQQESRRCGNIKWKLRRVSLCPLQQANFRISPALQSKATAMSNIASRSFTIVEMVSQETILRLRSGTC